MPQIPVRVDPGAETNQLLYYYLLDVMRRVGAWTSKGDPDAETLMRVAVLWLLATDGMTFPPHEADKNIPF